MELFEQYILNSAAIVAALIVVAIIFLIARRAYAIRKIELMFGQEWDESKTNELLAWTKVQYQLMEENAPAYQLEIVKEYMRLCKRRHAEYHSTTLPNGRVVLTSTLN